MNQLEEVIGRYDALGLTYESRDGKKLLSQFSTLDHSGDDGWDSVEELQRIAIEVRKIPEEKVADKAAFKERLLRFIASDDTKDRYGDRIAVDGKIGKTVYGEGWKLENFERNPVFMPFHDYAALPLGIALKTFKDVRPGRRKALRMAVLMDDGSSNALSPLMTNAYNTGLMRGNSVGFQPLSVFTPEDDDERKKLGVGQYGVIFGTQELWEDSAVSIPANPSALVENGIDCSDMKCFLRFADEARDIDPEFGYRVRSMIRTGFGQVYLNGVESWLQKDFDAKNWIDDGACSERVTEALDSFTTEADDTDDPDSVLEVARAKFLTPSLKELEDLKQAYRELAESLQDGIDELVAIAKGLDAQLSFLREANTNGPRPAPVPTRDAHVIEEMLRLGRETSALLKEEEP